MRRGLENMTSTERWRALSQFLPPSRFQHYKTREVSFGAGQATITTFLRSPKPAGGESDCYHSSKSAQAQASHESIMMHLILGESLPLRIVESQGCLNFMQTVDPRYKPLCRQTMKKDDHPQGKRPEVRNN